MTSFLKGNSVKRKGFSLVELVLSIVVIAISLMTVPLMLSQGAKSNQFALMQESILAARTKIANIMTYRWDEHSIDATGTHIRVLDVTDGDSELIRSTTVGRIGHVREDKRRRMHDNNTEASNGGSEALGVYDDIDDFHNETDRIIGTSSSMDYLDQNLSLTNYFSYLADETDYTQQTINFSFDTSSATFGVNQSTNIKMIELVATSINRDFPFVFRIFSSNIGQSNLYERVK